jgi:hypothetical protein
MFYLLKLLLLIIVIFKLKYSNLIFIEIMLLNASYVCLHAFSFRRESPDLDPRRRTLHSEVVLSHTAAQRLDRSHLARSAGAHAARDSGCCAGHSGTGYGKGALVMA